MQLQCRASKAVRAGSRDGMCWVGGREADTGTGTGMERAVILLLLLGAAAEDGGDVGCAHLMPFHSQHYRYLK